MTFKNSDIAKLIIDDNGNLIININHNDFKGNIPLSSLEEVVKCFTNLVDYYKVFSLECDIIVKNIDINSKKIIIDSLIRKNKKLRNKIIKLKSKQIKK